MRKGDVVYTPRFLKVTIEDVVPSEDLLRANGYTEPTYLYGGNYQVFGKSHDLYHMQFAAAVRDSVRKQFLTLAKPGEKTDFCQLLESAETNESVNEMENRAFRYLECLGNDAENDCLLWFFAIKDMPGYCVSLYDHGNGWWTFNGFVPEEEMKRIEGGLRSER